MQIYLSGILPPLQVGKDCIQASHNVFWAISTSASNNVIYKATEIRS